VPRVSFVAHSLEAIATALSEMRSMARFKASRGQKVLISKYLPAHVAFTT